MTMTIRNMTYALGGLVFAAFMNVSLNSCKSDNKKPTPEKEVKIEMNNDSLDTQILLHRNGIYDPTLSYAQAKIKLDSVMREKHPQTGCLEEALEMEDSIEFVNMCKSLGITPPQKPGPNATPEEEIEYFIRIITIYREADRKHMEEIIKILNEM